MLGAEALDESLALTAFYRAHGLTITETLPFGRLAPCAKTAARLSVGPVRCSGPADFPRESVQRACVRPLSNNLSTEKMWEAWKLCDASREYAQKAGRDVPPQEMIEKIFQVSGLVDDERTKREGSTTNYF